MKTRQKKQRAKPSGSRNKISARKLKTAQSDTKNKNFLRWSDGARTKLFFKYIIRKYMTLIRNIKVLSIEFTIFPLASVARFTTLRSLVLSTSGADDAEWNREINFLGTRIELIKLYILIISFFDISCCEFTSLLKIWHKIIVHMSHPASFIYHSSGGARHQLLIIIEIHENYIKIESAR